MRVALKGDVMDYLKHFYNTKGVVKGDERVKPSLLLQVADYLAQLCQFLWTARLRTASMFGAGIHLCGGLFGAHHDVNLVRFSLSL